jgi:hypothetical protein
MRGASPTKGRVLATTLSAAGVALVHASASAAARGRTQALVARLDRPAAPAASDRPLPDLVRAYVERVAGRPAPRLVRLRQRAEMRLGPDRPWHPVEAAQTIKVREPGFVWVAEMTLAPLLSVRILDSYVDGQGRADVRLFGSLPVARAAGPLLGKGELMRYLAELPWAPQAMLHNPRLRWRALDAATVEVSADSAAGPARVRLRFENGEIVGAEADDRPRILGRRAVPTPWRGRFYDHRELNGWRIPTWGEVGWIIGGQLVTVWRGLVTEYGTA